MKSKDRHKMHRNELADWLGIWIERLKPYSNLIFVAVVLVVGGSFAAVWWVRQAAAQTTQAWEGFYRAMSVGNPEELDKVIAQHPGTDAADWAAVLAGDVYLSTGCRRLFSNKSTAADDLRKAIEHYRTVQEESRVGALLERASFGLARAYEALAGTRESQGELDRAIEAYKELVEKFPDGAYAELAARRIQELSQQETKVLYDKFAQFDPRPAAPAAQATPGERLPFDWESLNEEGAFSRLSESLKLEDLKTDQPTTEDGSAAPTKEASAEDIGKPEETEAQGPAKPEEAPGQDAVQPEAAPAPSPSSPAPAEEPPDQPQAAADEPSDQGSTVSEKPPEAGQ